MKLNIFSHFSLTYKGQLISKYLFDAFTFYQKTNEKKSINPSIRDGVLRSGMLLYLHHRDSKIFFHPAKFDTFKDEKISDFKTVSVSQRKNLLD